VSGLLAAVAFLTRVPVPARPEATATSMAWFPVVGALVGLVGALAYALALVIAPPVLGAVLATAALVVLTGALHEDGLADSADAWGGGSTGEDALRILDDPAHGTYGVVALVLGLLLRVSALAAVTPAAALLILPAAHAMSRAAMVGVLATTPPARSGGLGARYAAFASRRTSAAALGGALIIGFGLVGLASVGFAAVAVAGAWLVRGLAMRSIGGVTGDILGATQQVIEVAILVSAAGLVSAGWGPG
jgi:adenosylcobinamide-GDP ribazoletransferase